MLKSLFSKHHRTLPVPTLSNKTKSGKEVLLLSDPLKYSTWTTVVTEPWVVNCRVCHDVMQSHAPNYINNTIMTILCTCHLFLSHRVFFVIYKYLKTLDKRQVEYECINQCSMIFLNYFVLVFWRRRKQTPDPSYGTNSNPGRIRIHSTAFQETSARSLSPRAAAASFILDSSSSQRGKFCSV